MDPGLNNLLKWSIENSESSRATLKTEEGPDEDGIDEQHVNGDTGQGDGPVNRGLDAAALSRLLGGPSDADLMKEAMHVIQNPEADLDAKLIAFDNFEQLIESLDNANNMEPMGLWSPLVDQLDSPAPEIRKMACWCLGTAVQNNSRAQERMLVVGAVPKLVKVATDKDQGQDVRRKAIYAISSEVRNYQVGLDEVWKYLPADIVGEDTGIAAGDMDAIDRVIDRLRAIGS